jgi:hypothetical protein
MAVLSLLLSFFIPGITKRLRSIKIPRRVSSPWNMTTSGALWSEEEEEEEELRNLLAGKE